MEKLDRQVRRARRRLYLQRFVGALAWTWFAGLLIALVAIAAPKIRVVDVAPNVWTWSWIGGAVGLGLLAAVAWTCATGQTAIEAAIEIDRRFALKERVSSTLALDGRELNSKAGRALVDDAVRRVDRIDVAERFDVKARWPALLPLVPAAAVFALVVFVPDAVRDRTSGASEGSVAIKRRIKNSTDALKKEIAERRKAAAAEEFKDAEAIFKELEAGIDKLSGEKKVDRKKAMVRLSNLANDLKRRRDSLGNSDQIKKQLGGLKNLKQGPADKLAKALKNGDFNKALGELKNLRRQLGDDDLTPQEKEQLAAQLDEMAKKLGDLADAHRQAEEDLKRQIEEKKKAGDLATAGKLQDQLDRLARQDRQMDRVREAADKLGQCRQCLEDGNLQDAAAHLDELAGDLQDLQRQIDEMEMLDDALDQIAGAKEGMNCPGCDGQGCPLCQGGGKKDGPPGRGLGEGSGKGDRPEEKTDTGGYLSQVRGKVGPGKGIITGEVAGPNVAGEARQEIKTAITAAKRASAKPLTDEPLPRRQREHVREYLDSIREGD